jgi:hypothetical protein
MKLKKTVTIFPLLAFFLVLWHSAAPAQENPATRVLVTVLYASNDSQDFDLENDAYRDEIIKLFSYTGYRQIGVRFADLEKGIAEKVMLPGDYDLLLTYDGTENARLLVRALIQKDGEQYVNTVLSSVEGGVVFLGGPPLQNGVMIIVLEMGF